MTSTDVDDLGDCLDSCPVPLKPARRRHPADRLGPGLNDPFQPRSVRHTRGATDRVNHGKHLVSSPERVQRGICETDLGPQRGHDQLLASCCLDGSTEVEVLP